MRLFTDQQIRAGKNIILSTEQKNHIRVLRIKDGDLIFMFNKRDGLWRGKLNKNHVLLESKIESFQERSDVILYFGLCKKNTTDFILEKGTEMGVTHFYPVLTSYAQRYFFNLQRAKNILISATQQCERLDVPNIFNPITWEQIMYISQTAKIHVCLERIGLKKLSCHTESLFIGPEGGFSFKERKFINDNMLSIGLGNRILRVETAVICALSLVLFQDAR